MNTIAKLIIPDGGDVRGTRVQLSDGSFINNIEAIHLRGDMDNPFWRMTVDIRPIFIEQLPVDVQLCAVNIGNINDLSDEDLAAIGLQRINRGTF